MNLENGADYSSPPRGKFFPLSLNVIPRIPLDLRFDSPFPWTFHRFVFKLDKINEEDEKGDRLERRKGRTQLIPVLGLYYISWLRYQASQQPTSRLSAFVPIHLLPITAPTPSRYARTPHRRSPFSSPFLYPPSLLPIRPAESSVARLVSIRRGMNVYLTTLPNFLVKKKSPS